MAYIEKYLDTYLFAYLQILIINIVHFMISNTSGFCIIANQYHFTSSI